MTNPLTPKEQAAWDLACKGMPERAIALHFKISRSAVRSRLENARRKLARKDAA